jgi:hypothetical protein
MLTPIPPPLLLFLPLVFGIRRAGQQNVVLCIQRGVAPGFQLAARNHDVAAVRTFVFAVRGDGQIVAGVQRAACHRITFSMLL